MSETSSDTESSCGWTIISHEGSDIETLGLEAAVVCGAELLERPPLEDGGLQDSRASAPGGCVEGRTASLDDTLVEEAVDATQFASGDIDNAARKEHVTLLSSSDHSDIVTLRDLKEDEQADVEEEEEEAAAAASEEFFLGTSCSSQYTFTAAETGLMMSHWKIPQSLMNLGYHLRSQLTGGRSPAVFPVQKPALTNSSSSEDEAGRSHSTVTRRRRVRRNTTSIVTEPEEEEALESSPSEEMEEEEKQQQEEEQAEVRPALNVRMQGQGSGILNTCVLLALVIAISMGFGHFYGTVQIQERRKNVEKIRASELDAVRDLLQQQDKEQPLTKQAQGGEFDLKEMDDQKVIAVLTDMIEKMKREKQEINIKQTHIQAQRDNFEMLLKQNADEKNRIVAQQHRLTAENQQLKSSLEREEKYMSTLQEQLRNLSSKIRDMETMGAEADSLLSENQRMKEQLEEKKKLIRNFQAQREGLMAEAQTLRKKLEKERRVTDELRRELNRLRSDIPGDEKEEASEAEELQSRLMDLEKRLSFEQQRSDLWERLYVETKAERAKGDTESKMKKTKEGMAGKVKETFDAVKNSTKEFVHHHKEQIKKAKEAVKENLRKFSDSVKSTFRHFKNSASSFINKARGFYSKRCSEKNPKEPWQQSCHKPHGRHSHKYDGSFHSNHNTRKSGQKVYEDQGQNSHKANTKGCSSVYDCAHQEFMSLFNKAMEPIRADEFHQLLQSYLHQEVDHFRHWKELEMFVNNFFHNGLFIHDQMLFTDFVSGVEDYLADMHEYHGHNDDMFGDLDDYVYRHFFGKEYTKSYGPSKPRKRLLPINSGLCPDNKNGPFEKPDADSKEESRSKQQQRKQPRARSRPHERTWSRSVRNRNRHMADVKIELGPMPFDPKY